MTSILFTIVILFLTLMTFGKQECPENLCSMEECACNNSLIVLHGFPAKVRIAKIVQDMPDKFNQVVFYYGNKKLDHSVFRGKKSLIKIISDGNKYENPPAKNFIKITTDAFKGLYNLQELQLKRYNLHTLDDGVFNGLISLRNIDLTENSFTKMPPLQKMYTDIPKSAQVVYTGNKFECTCYDDWENIQWAQTYRKGMFKDLICKNHGKNIYDVNYSTVCAGCMYKSYVVLPILLAFLIRAFTG